MELKSKMQVKAETWAEVLAPETWCNIPKYFRCIHGFSLVAAAEICLSLMACHVCIQLHECEMALSLLEFYVMRANNSYHIRLSFFSPHCFWQCSSLTLAMLSFSLSISIHSSGALFMFLTCRCMYGILAELRLNSNSIRLRKLLYSFNNLRRENFFTN